MIDAWRAHKDEDPDLKAQIHREPLFESPEVTFQFAQNSQDYRFIFGKTPFNSDDTNSFINNKWALYETLHDSIPFPHTEAMAKKSDQSHDNIRDSITAKINDPEHPFSLPIILKPNSGSLSVNVFVVEDEEQLLPAIKAIREDSDHGDQLLVQQYLGDENGPFQEIRAICLDGKGAIVFEKNTDNATRGVLANPIYWDGAIPKEITDPDILQQIDAIATRLHNDHGASYVGFDLMHDNEGRIWVLEANAAPMGLEKVEREMPNGRHLIDDLTNRMLEKIKHGQDAQSDSPSEGLSLH